MPRKSRVFIKYARFSHAIQQVVQADELVTGWWKTWCDAWVFSHAVSVRGPFMQFGISSSIQPIDTLQLCEAGRLSIRKAMGTLRLLHSSRLS